MKKKLVIAVVALAVLLTSAWAVLLAWSPSPAAITPFPLDLERVRALAGTGSASPDRINAVLMGTSRVPAGVAIAGDSLFRELVFSSVAYQVVYPDGKTIIVDTANDRYLHDEWSDGDFDAEAYAALQSAMTRAEAIVVTHEHFDHVGGIARADDIAAIEDRVHLTSEQLAGPTLDWAEFLPGYEAALQPLQYDRLHRLSPGVVLIKAPGHTAGSQMVYVRLQSGAEYLFVGDISWQLAGIERVRCKALLAALLAREDRAQVLAQLVTLEELLETTDIHVVVSHDMAQLRHLHRSRALGDRFE